MEYRLSIDSEVLHFFVSLNEDEQALVLRWLGKLQAQPFTRGRYNVQDSVGRDVEVSIFSIYIVYHWTDHAVKTVNVIGMERA